ncbi:MAG: ATP-binding protein [Ginsengibacter sp.]
MADDTSFASLSLADSGWLAINPAADIINSQPANIKKGIGWLRLTMEVPPALRNNTLGILVQQSGASEIYLNGNLIGKYGSITLPPDKTQPYDPRWQNISFHLNNDSVQLLAVRFALRPNELYTTFFETSNPIIILRLYNYQKAASLYSDWREITTAFEFIEIGLCLMLLIIHFSLFVLYPSQKANLYFSLFAVNYIIAAVIQWFFYLNVHTPNLKFFTGNITFALFMLCDIFILFSIKTFLKEKASVYVKILIPAFLLALFLNAYFYDWGWRVGGVSFKLLTQTLTLTIAVKAQRKNYRGARVLFWGALATIILFFTFILQGTFYQHNLLESLPLLRVINYLLFMLSIPLAVSFYLASDVAYTTRKLSQKLNEVDELSKKNLSIEKEKQEMLTSQNVRLEKLVEERTGELKQSLEELKSTQSQLIQSEKMASLGELTAGIAHEIQNPLNFVNNFSEVNREMLEELKTERLKPDEERDDDLQNDLINDVIENSEKILHHGKRADAIVKGMLQHSRQSSGQREPTDINALADEYLRLSYHGMRAKDKSFNAEMKTDFDESLGKINIIPQDIGRVLLNLFNNAFYAVSKSQEEQGKEFEPTVSVSTKKSGNSVLITVSDNGNGIPQKNLDKIFQPFFTTKPAGDGTGLGLSLSYDIIKAHGGEIKVESKEGEGSEFVIRLNI